MAGKPHILHILYINSIVPGDFFIVYGKKAVSFLKLRPAVSSPGSDPVTVPVTSQTEFALTPRCEDSNGTDAATWSWEREFQSVGELIKVLKSQDMPVPCVSIYSIQFNPLLECTMPIGIH